MSKWLKVRYIQMVLLFFLMALAYGIRTILSVAIVAMTNPTSSNPDIPVYTWTNTGLILSSFYWSYAVLQFFAGPIAHSFSAKWILTGSMIANAGACLLIPVLSEFGYEWLFFLRALQGVAQGFMIPLTHSMLGKWAPTDERSWIATTVYSGCSFGTIISMPVTGYLSASSYGWPASFYLFGCMGLLWTVFWALYSADRPATHKTISDDERKYIEGSLGQEDAEDKVEVPWKAIASSLPYWAIIMGAIGESWGSTFLITEMPTYISKVTDIDIDKSSLFSSAPYIVAAIMTLIYGPLADYLIKLGLTSRINSRRIFHGVGSFLPAIALVWLAYEQSRLMMAVLLIVAISLNGAMFCGHNVNHIDISPRFSGVLFGISNGIGQGLAILAPVLVQYVVYDETDKTLWRTMFIVAASIYAATALFFILYSSAERQWWDNARFGPQDRREMEKL